MVILLGIHVGMILWMFVYIDFESILNLLEIKPRQSDDSKPRVRWISASRCDGSRVGISPELHKIFGREWEVFGMYRFRGHVVCCIFSFFFFFGGEGGLKRDFDKVIWLVSHIPPIAGVQLEC